MRHLKPARSLLVLAAAIAVGLVLALPANAATPIVNGGFETGDLTGWNTYTPGGSAYVVSGGAPQGTYYGEVQAGNGNTWMTLSQTYSSGSTHRVTFMVRFLNGETGGYCDYNDQARVRVDGSTVWSASSYSTGTTAWTRVTTGMLGGGTHTVSFEVLNISDSDCDSYIDADALQYLGLYKAG